MGRRDIDVRPAEPARLARAKQSFATRRVPLDAARTIISGGVRPRSGDLVLAQVARLGHHRRIEQPNGRRSQLHLGDEIIVAYADRYATDQFESHVPETLGHAHLVASGGIASKVLTRSAGVRAATDIVPVGLLGDEHGLPLNVEQFALPLLPPPSTRPRTVAVLGTAMNAGKTTTIHYLAHGLAKAGARPGVTKVTGTGSGNDYWVMLDAGAHRMLDFTDAGLASSFRHPIPVLEQVMSQLVWNLTADGCGVNFVEIADGVFQQENRRLLRSDVLHPLVDAVVLAGSDAMGAALGVQVLTDHGFDVVAVSGSLTKSPLAMREAEEAIGLPVWGLDELQDARRVAPVLGIPESTLVTTPTPLPEWEIELEGLGDRADARTARDHSSDPDASREEFVHVRQATEVSA